MRFDVDMPITEAEDITTVKEAIDYLTAILRMKAVAN